VVDGPTNLLRQTVAASQKGRRLMALSEGIGNLGSPNQAACQSVKDFQWNPAPGGEAPIVHGKRTVAPRCPIALARAEGVK